MNDTDDNDNDKDNDGGHYSDDIDNDDLTMNDQVTLHTYMDVD